MDPLGMVCQFEVNNNMVDLRENPPFGSAYSCGGHHSCGRTCREKIFSLKQDLES